MRTDRRTYLKMVASGGAIASLAGCTQGGDSSGGGSSNGGSTSTSTESFDLDPEEMDHEEYAKEWRAHASEMAAEELKDTTMPYYASHMSEIFREKFINRDFSGPYEVLTDNLDPLPSPGGDLQTKYVRVNEANQPGFDVMDLRMEELVQNGIEVGDMSGIPSFRVAPENTTYENWLGARAVWSYGVYYNEERIGDPPTTWEEILDVPDDEIILDYTPSGKAVGALLRTKGVEYLEKLGEKDITMISSGRTTGERVANGEFGLAFLNPSGSAFDGGSAPVPNPDMHFFWSKPLHMSSNPLCPWAAKLTIDCLMNPEHTTIQSMETGRMALDLETSTPDRYSEIFNGKLWTPGDFDKGLSEYGNMYREALGAPTA